MRKAGEAKTADIAEQLGLSPDRTRAINYRRSAEIISTPIEAEHDTRVDKEKNKP